MRKVIIAVTVVVLMIGSLSAAEKSDRAEILALLNQLVDAASKGDTKTFLAGMTDEMSIIDEFAPYEWHGPGTCAKWLADFDADNKARGITSTVISIGKPRHVDVTGDRAYVVVPAGYTYTQNGKAKKQSGATWTVTLQKGKEGWRVTGWCWSKP
jgi:ketosteroid isomerase-like protein